MDIKSIVLGAVIASVLIGAFLATSSKVVIIGRDEGVSIVEPEPEPPVNREVTITILDNSEPVENGTMAIINKPSSCPFLATTYNKTSNGEIERTLPREEFELTVIKDGKAYDRYINVEEDNSFSFDLAEARIDQDTTKFWGYIEWFEEENFTWNVYGDPWIKARDGNFKIEVEITDLELDPPIYLTYRYGFERRFEYIKYSFYPENYTEMKEMYYSLDNSIDRGYHKELENRLPAS